VATNRVRDLLLRLTGDPSDAKQALRDVARDVDAFGRLKAEATVDVNTKPAEEALVGATAAVKKFDTLTATAKIDLQVAGAEAQLNRLRTRLENLSKQGASPKVDIQVAKTVAQIERVEAKLTALGRRKVDIDVDIKRGALESIGGAIRGAVGAVGGALGGGGGALFGGLSKISSAVSGLLPLLRGAAVLIGIALAPALLALAASALAAAAGVAALATALAVAMGPVVLVAVAAFTRLAKVLEAVKENKDKVAAGAERVRDAHQREAQATENLQRAQEHARDTAVEAYRAQAQAAEDAADAVLSLEHAELSREQAQLNLVKAKDALHDFRRENDLLSSSLDGLFRKFTDVSFRPESLIKAVRGSELGGAVGGGDKSTELTQLLIDVKDAKLGIKDADDTVADSKTKLNEASAKEAEFAQNGLAAYEPYQQALEQVADAQHGVRDATEAMTTARREQQKALKELDPQERKLADVFTRLQKTLTAVFRPATDAIFKGVISFLNDLEDFAGDSKVRAGFTNIGRAIGTIFTALGREMRKREFRDGFKDFADSAARMIRALGGAGLRDFLTIMLRIARVALPAVERFVGSIADKLEDWRKGTDNSKRLHSRIEDLLKSTRRWANLLKAAFDFLSALFGPAKKSGDSLVVSRARRVHAAPLGRRGDRHAAPEHPQQRQPRRALWRRRHDDPGADHQPAARARPRPARRPPPPGRDARARAPPPRARRGRRRGLGRMTAFTAAHGILGVEAIHLWNGTELNRQLTDAGACAGRWSASTGSPACTRCPRPTTTARPPPGASARSSTPASRAGAPSPTRAPSTAATCRSCAAPPRACAAPSRSAQLRA
jgi:hypothetical protein